MNANWPELSYIRWQDTCSALHLYCQVVGKYRLARTPWINHSWQAAFYVGARGLSTTLIHDGASAIEITFDLINHSLVACSTEGRTVSFRLGPMSVAEFHRLFLEMIGSLGGTLEFDGKPNEVLDPIPFVTDAAYRPYDEEAVSRFFVVLVSVDRVLKRFRTSFLGKVSPVHLFWGSFDLALTRFSGRRAPLHPGGIPALPDAVTREAYSHEVSSAGFWPGGGGADFPAFYSYAYPVPAGFDEARISPDEAYFDYALGEFILPYDAVRKADDPEDQLMLFLESTYGVAADLGRWPRANLECPLGIPRRPRSVAE